MKQFFGFFILLVCFAACQSSKNLAGSSNYQVNHLVVDKSPCFGACPVYKLEVAEHGEAHLEARNFLKNKLKGNYSAKLDSEDMEKLRRELELLNFTKLSDSYGNKQVTDLPTTDLEIRYNGNQTKKIHDYGNQGTPALAKFYVYIDSLIYAQQWLRKLQTE